MFLRCLVVMLTALMFTVLADAGLDTDATHNHVIGIYHFESTEERENGTTYTPDSGIRKINGNLSEDASLSDSGKYGKALLLKSQDNFCAPTLSKSPTFPSDEYSIVAWVKLPKQLNEGYLNLMMQGFIITDDDAIVISAIGLSVVPDGNLNAFHSNLFINGETISVLSENQNVANNRWHHIAFARYANTLSLYIDGSSVASHQTTKFPEFLGNYTCLGIFGAASGVDFTGNVLVDDAGFFETGFSSYEIKGLYDDGLSDFLEAMPVNPEEKVATTWGEIKTRRF